MDSKRYEISRKQLILEVAINALVLLTSNQQNAKSLNHNPEMLPMKTEEVFFAYDECHLPTEIARCKAHFL
ncbi:hypothetical protein [Listeria seeligeri]|uniref:hypothetical protein n=1 Tax=Listeria seeligeri TaxID=1640 RepID=UPI0010EDF0B5|nr:hypothetical protein [Listeria seeligeri]MBC1732686.1 hypothetical protein [Listeria seeligeri]MBC1810382.1 hypothetical protein [Listeria seeligeri]MBC1895451.1 hypothetical protein [Listeria seeligeri]MBC1901426.1 hypothetical protein [Listeria seeligeri]MBC1996558.1 hypothetical protein [Listeria seeligeri]